MVQVIPTDVYDNNGNLLRVEFHNSKGEFEIQAEWDERDLQTSDNREAFRKWAYKMIENMGFKVKL